MALARLFRRDPMSQLLRRLALPTLAIGVLAVPSLSAAHAAAPTDTPPVGLLCNGATPTMWATADNQTITGTDGNDIIAANGFHSLTLKGGAGNDTICGAAHAIGAGVYNGPGSGLGTGTTLDGGAGNDTVISIAGRDRVVGGQGDDRLVGTVDTIVDYSMDGYTGGAGVAINLAAGTVTGARTGKDTLTGLDGAWFVGTEGSDSFAGDEVANRFEGEDGADRIAGKSGADFFSAIDPSYVHAGAGADTVMVAYGGTVLGGRGDDIITATPADVYFDLTTDPTRPAPTPSASAPTPRFRGKAVSLAARVRTGSPTRSSATTPG